MDLELDRDRIQEFADKGNYHAAINIALSCMNERRKISDQAGVDEFLAIINGVVQQLSNEFGSKK